MRLTRFFLLTAGICGRGPSGGSSAGAQATSSHPTHPQPRSSPSTPAAGETDTNQKGMLCDNCNVKFTLFNRKVSCAQHLFAKHYMTVLIRKVSCQEPNEALQSRYFIQIHHTLAPLHEKLIKGVISNSETREKSI